MTLGDIRGGLGRVGKGWIGFSNTNNSGIPLFSPAFPACFSLAQHTGNSFQPGFAEAATG